MPNVRKVAIARSSSGSGTTRSSSATGTSSSGSSNSSSGSSSGSSGSSSTSGTPSSNTASTAERSVDSAAGDVLSNMLTIQRSVNSKQADLAAAHKARINQLAAERDKISARFSDLVLSAKNPRSQLPRPSSPATRERVLKTFQDSQAFSTSRLRALKKGKTLMEAEKDAGLFSKRPPSAGQPETIEHVHFQGDQSRPDVLPVQHTAPRSLTAASINSHQSGRDAESKCNNLRTQSNEATRQAQEDVYAPATQPAPPAFCPPPPLPQWHASPYMANSPYVGPHPVPQYTGDPQPGTYQPQHPGYAPWDPGAMHAWHGSPVHGPNPVAQVRAHPPTRPLHTGQSDGFLPPQPPPRSVDGSDTSKQHMIAKRLCKMSGHGDSEPDARSRALQDSPNPEAPQMKELREMLTLLRTALSERGRGKSAAGSPPEDELRDLERQIARQKKVAQLATIKAKSEALRLRQEFELEKFRAKYRGAPKGADSPEPAARPPEAAGLLDGEPPRLVSSSDGSLSIGADEAFDEPLKVVSVEVVRGGPFAAAGAYRVTATLYTAAAPVPAPVGAGAGPASGATSSSTAAVAHAGAAAPGAGATGGSVVWHSGLTLAGAHVDECSQVVLEVYRQKQSVLGVAQPDEVIAWTTVQLRDPAAAAAGSLRSLPLYNPPVAAAPGAQRFPVAGAASLQFHVYETQCRPGDMAPVQRGGAGAGPGGPASGGATAGLDSAAADAAAASGGGPLAGVPETLPPEQYISLAHEFKPPLEPYQPGAGIAVVIDALRFLPGNVTVASVAGTFWSAQRESVATGFHMVPQAASDALSPQFFQSHVIGAPPEPPLQDATATLILEVTTVDRFSLQLRVVGYSAVPLFARATDGSQPEDRTERAITPNEGAFQLPLWPAHPPLSGPLCAAALQARARLPCASVLVRVMPASELRKNPEQPRYADQIYHSRLMAPTDTEKLLYGYYAGRAADTVRSRAGELAAAPPAAAAAGASVPGRILKKLSSMDAGARQRASEVLPGSAATSGGPPGSDADLADWALARLTPPPMWPRPLLDLTFAHPYLPPLGFAVSVDAAARLGRALPAIALTSIFPPGSFYQDHPVSDDVKATLMFDLDSPLLAPRWLDGPQPLRGYEAAPFLAAIIDVRYLVPATGSSTPAGFAVLPVLRRPPRAAPGPELYVATGAYQLPLFKGVPSMALLAEMKRRGDVEETLAHALREKRLKMVDDCTSVLVRVLDEQRPGLASAPAWAVPEADRAVPEYARAAADKLNKPLGRAAKVLRRAVPGGMTDAQFVHDLNAATLRLAGLQDGPGDSAAGYGDGSMAAA